MLSPLRMYPPSRRALPFVSSSSSLLRGLLLLGVVSCSSPVVPEGQHETNVAPAAPIQARDVAFVIRVGGRPSIVLAQTVPAAWTPGPASVMLGEDVLTVRKDVRVASLPQDLRADLGKTVTMMGAHGNMCTARIGAPVAVARIVADGPTADAAEEELDVTARAARVWESDVADHQLVAALEPVRGDCEGALYAKYAEDNRTWSAASAPTGPQEQIARSAFRALPQYHDMSEEREEADDALPPEPTVRTFDAGNVRYYFVSEGEESTCGVQNVGALFRADRAETPRELELVAVSTELSGDVVGVVHDGTSGEVHVLYTDYELRLRAGHEVDQRRTVRVPFEGCGC